MNGQEILLLTAFVIFVVAGVKAIFAEEGEI